MDYEPPPAFSQPQERLGPLPSGGAVPPALPAPEPLRRPMSATATVVAVAAVVVAALAVVGIVLLVRAGGGPQRRVSLPQAAGSFRLIRSIDGDTAEAMLGSAAGSLGPISSALATAEIGLYGSGAGADALPTVIFLGFNRADSATIDSLLRGRSADRVAGELLDGTASAAPRSFDPGPLGGSLQCASAERSGTAFTPCAWADSSTVALVLRVGTVGESDAAALTRQFRAAAEH